MPDPIKDTKGWSPEKTDAVRRDVEEEDESGAPEKVAWPESDEGHLLESEDECVSRGEDVTGSAGAATDLEERVQDES
jgi:hypothetical protein